MGYRIPSRTRLREAIAEVLLDAGAVRSQTQLAELVAERLHEEDPTFRVAGERVRRIAVEMPQVRVTITARRSHDDVEGLSDCPVCGHGLRIRQNQTLDGGVVPLDRRCSHCPYWTGQDRRVPTRYAFHYRTWETLVPAHPGQA